jgi:4-amino-4-deoxy-L-arabinose transferase-like glycosyltransferase
LDCSCTPFRIGAEHRFNEYIGPFHQYLLFPLAQTFGYRVWVLRSLSVIASLLSIGLLFLVVRRLFDARLAAIAALTLASIPRFTQ